MGGLARALVVSFNGDSASLAHDNTISPALLSINSLCHSIWCNFVQRKSRQSTVKYQLLQQLYLYPFSDNKLLFKYFLSWGNMLMEY